MDRRQMRRWFSPLLALSFVAALSTEALLAPAAENFVCGVGGTPDPKTSKCNCPPGTLEKTTGGTSRCVDKPVVATKPTGIATTPTTAPTAPTIAPSTATTTTTPPTFDTTGGAGTTPPPAGTGTGTLVVGPTPIENGTPVELPPPTPRPEAGYVPSSEGPSDRPVEPRRYPQPNSDLHTYLETRLGLTTMLQKSSGYGPSLDLSYGMGFSWIDVGIIGRFASIPVKDTDGNARQFSIGPEIATRTYLGGPMTFRLGIDPLYTLETFNGQTHSLVGVDGLAQFLFTIDDASRPVWRLGLGFHGGRRWPTSGGDGIWMVGADVVVRTWW